jgi:hypothetical protein
MGWPSMASETELWWFLGIQPDPSQPRDSDHLEAFVYVWRYAAFASLNKHRSWKILKERLYSPKVSTINKLIVGRKTSKHGDLQQCAPWNAQRFSFDTANAEAKFGRGWAASMCCSFYFTMPSCVKNEDSACHPFCRKDVEKFSGADLLVRRAVIKRVQQFFW